jgi:hypothetical protein
MGRISICGSSQREIRRWKRPVRTSSDSDASQTTPGRVLGFRVSVQPGNLLWELTGSAGLRLRDPASQPVGCAWVDTKVQPPGFASDDTREHRNVSWRLQEPRRMRKPTPWKTCSWSPAVLGMARTRARHCAGERASRPSSPIGGARACRHPGILHAVQPERVIVERRYADSGRLGAERHERLTDWSACRHGRH